MNTDQPLNPDSTLGLRGRNLGWIAAGVAVLAMLILLGPAPGSSASGDTPNPPLTTRAMPQPVTATHANPMSSQVDWSTLQAEEEPSPLAVAAY